MKWIFPHFDIIVPSVSRYCKWSAHFWFSTWGFICIFHLPHICYMHCLYLIFLDLFALIICQIFFQAVTRSQERVVIFPPCFGSFVGHPSCLDLTLDMVPHIRRYDWQCTDCKTCIQCKDPADEDKMLFCDMCDRG